MTLYWIKREYLRKIVQDEGRGEQILAQVFVPSSILILAAIFPGQRCAQQKFLQLPTSL